MENKGISNKLDAWLAFLSMYSEELKILDRNTVRYMGNQMQEEIE